MTPSLVLAQLAQVEQILRSHHQWSDTAPESAAWLSDQPFFMNTMTPCEWLQWVLIPRLTALIDAGQPLPGAMAVTPYYEIALDADHPGRHLLLAELQCLDALFSGAANA